MGKEDKEKEKGPMDGCPVPCPKVDEGKLLNDCRSPRFFRACQKLQIDPLELRPREFQSFAQPGLAHEKQQVRMAMYERSRLAKWQAINSTRFSLPKGDTTEARSKSAELLRNSSEKEEFSNTISWMPAERARTVQQMNLGQVEVVKITAKRLRDITAVGDFASEESVEAKQKALEQKHAAEKKRKADLKKAAEKLQLQKEKERKELKEREEVREKLKEMEQQAEAKLKALRQSWEAESEEKKQKQREHHEQVARNLKEADRKKEENIQELLRDFERKDQQVERMRNSLFGSSGVGEELSNSDFPGSEEQARKAQEKRDLILRRAEAKTKQLIAQHHQKEAEAKEKEAVRQEKLKELTKERKDKEQATRERLADAQRKKAIMLKERENKVLDKLASVDESLKKNKEQIQKELEIKVELDKIKFDQAQENVRRVKAQQRQAARELTELHDGLSAIKAARDEALDQLKRTRQLQATKIRLKKDELREEVFMIQVQNAWGKANKILGNWEKEGMVAPLEKQETVPKRTALSPSKPPPTD